MNNTRHEDTVFPLHQEIDARCRASFRSLCPAPELLNRVESKNKIAQISPLTDLPTICLAQGRRSDVVAAFERGRRAQKRWAQLPIKERARRTVRLINALWAHREQLLDVIQWESGKARVDANEELTDQLSIARYLKGPFYKVLKPQRAKGLLPFLTRVDIHRVPLGVVGVISPWNFPLTLITNDAIFALIAGNAVVIKPDTKTPLTALVIRQLMNDCGFEDDIFQVVCGVGEDIGPDIVEHADYVMFTGSSETGTQVATRCAQRLVECSLELGGKNPLIVLEDADVEKAVPGARRAFLANNGALCLSIERIYVHEKLWDKFVPAFIDCVNTTRIEASLSWQADMGVLISREHLQIVAQHVDDAVQKGATILTGGYALPKIAPTAYAPTVLVDVTEDMDVYSKETFGPLVSLYPFKDEEEVIRLANDSNYGLNCSIWGKPSHARRIAQHIRTGTVVINDAYASAWSSIDAPMGGMGISGIGRRHGKEGFIKYTDTQSVVTQHLFPLFTPRFLTHRAFGKLTGFGMRVLTYIPWV
ncbi:MAG: succinic semialdehyde dehydrogenase [Actinomycetaceae bacterium]|nr:succinic semialdehyde dehydrogenase [Actinomycetaceae bacterium]